MAIVNDSHLAYLLSLGFDIDLCKQALTQNSTLENATEWILNPSQPPDFNNGVIPDSTLDQPSLPTSTPFSMDHSQPFSSAGPLNLSSTSPSTTSRKAADEEEIKFQKKKFEKIANEIKKDKQMEMEARQRALKEIKEDQERRRARKSVGTTAQTTTNETAGVQQQNLSERKRVQLDYRKEKRAEQEQRQRILQNIRNDQKDKKMRKLSSFTSQDTTVASTSSSSGADTTNSKPVDMDQHAFIQFKLTDASILRQKFPASTNIKELLEFVLSKEIAINSNATIDNTSLICPFPRRTFTIEDQALNIREAGFLPNVSLNVVVILPPQPPQEDQQEQENQHEEEMADAEQEQDDDSHSADSDTDTESDSDEEHDDMDIDHDHFHAMPRRRPVWDGPNAPQGHTLTDPSPAVAVGNDSADTVMEENEEQLEIDRRRHMLSAIEQRSSSANQTTKTATTVGKERYAKALKDITTTSVALFLNQHTTNTTRYLKKLSYVSSELAESLMAYLIKNGKLNVSTFKKLADHCYLQYVVLDSYTYCTDSLIDALCLSNSNISMTKLSLRGCDVITDSAIRSLEQLKNLTYLDLNNCKVTDKGLKSLEKLPYLLYLNLSKTKITNAGVFSIVKNAKFKSELQVLLLDGCTRLHSNHLLIPIINEFVNLLQLSYAYTMPSKTTEQTPSQVITNKQVRLEQLDVSHTFVSDQYLIETISQFKSLVELKLAGCESLTTRSLSFLPRDLKNLRLIQFPNREHELDGVLLRYKDLPIEHLDLTGYLNVTDEGAQHIASMTKLRYLSLDGTKVTDQGIVLFTDLIELEKLYLDRTALTDVGLEKLTGLSKLETLSLSRTEVSDEGLCLLGDFEETSFARNLRTLNLAQCHLVSNRGVRGLAGMLNLCNLNLDHTSVSKSCLKYLKDLKNLNLVRLQGIEKEEDDATDLD